MSHARRFIPAAVALFVSISSPVLAKDSNPAQALVERAARAVKVDPEASRRDAEQALQLLKRTPDVDLEIRAHLLLCDYQFERDTQAAEAEVRSVEALLPHSHRKGLRAGMLNCQGQIVETTGDYMQARALYEEAVAVATAARDDEILAVALYLRGYVLGLQGQYATGLADLKQAQALFERVHLPNDSLMAINSIAILYNRMGDYAQARHMYARALKAQREAGIRREQGVTLHNLGRAHENLREWRDAAAAFEQSYQISHELNYARGEAYALRGLAAVANAEGRPRDALATLERASVLQRQTPDARLSGQIDLARGTALHQLKRFADAIPPLQSALKIFEQADSLNELRATYAELAATYADIGDWKSAHAYLLKAQSTAERLFRNQVDQRFATLKVEFDTAAKEQENALLVRENEANTKALEQERRARALQAAVIALTVVLAALLATLAWHQWRTTRRMRRLAMTDELTGAPNRRSVLKRLGRLLEHPESAACAMIIVDIDHFKSINDQHGHAEGDEALKTVAANVLALIHEPAFLGRLGGEEFVVVLPGRTLAEACEFAEIVRQKVMTIDTSRWLPERAITVSSGVTVSSAQGTDTPSTMLQRADAALYEAKRSGRNCVRSQSPDELPIAAAALSVSAADDGQSIKYA